MKLLIWYIWKKKYKVEYKKHDFSEGLLVLKERNYHMQKIYNERFYNLYNSTPNLSFIDQRSWPSYELNEGIHNIVIKAKEKLLPSLKL